MRASTPEALVVLSGGQDSTTCLALAVDRYGPASVLAVYFAYGQLHEREGRSAAMVADYFGAALRVVTLGPILEGSSPLTDRAQELERYGSFEEMERVIGDRVERTFVPMRNALFLTLAANVAAARGIRGIWTGVCQADNANYPDCRRSFVDAFEAMTHAALGSDDLGVWTPLMNLSKAESVSLALRTPGAYEALALTHTAYDGSYPPRGDDHASVLRARGFEEAGVPDPLIFRAWAEGALGELPRGENYERLRRGSRDEQNDRRSWTVRRLANLVGAAHGDLGFSADRVAARHAAAGDGR